MRRTCTAVSQKKQNQDCLSCAGLSLSFQTKPVSWANPFAVGIIRLHGLLDQSRLRRGRSSATYPKLRLQVRPSCDPVCGARILLSGHARLLFRGSRARNRIALRARKSQTSVGIGFGGSTHVGLPPSDELRFPPARDMGRHFPGIRSSARDFCPSLLKSHIF